MARSEALMPPGPAPTMQTSLSPGASGPAAARRDGGRSCRRIAPLVHRVLDQRQPAQLTDDEEVAGWWSRTPGVSRRQVGRSRWDSPSRSRWRRPDRRRRRDHGRCTWCRSRCAAFPPDHGQHIAFGTGLGAGAAADAVVDVDMGMLGPGAVAVSPQLGPGFPRRPLLPPVGNQVGREGQQRTRAKARNIERVT